MRAGPGDAALVEEESIVLMDTHLLLVDVRRCVEEVMITLKQARRLEELVEGDEGGGGGRRR